MAETYSIGATGLPADSPFALSTLKIGDTAGLLGGQQLCMAQNTQVLCKKRDGSQAWYTIDAERSTPSAVVLKAV